MENLRDDRVAQGDDVVAKLENEVEQCEEHTIESQFIEEHISISTEDEVFLSCQNEVCEPEEKLCFHREEDQVIELEADESHFVLFHFHVLPIYHAIYVPYALKSRVRVR